MRTEFTNSTLLYMMTLEMNKWDVGVYLLYLTVCILLCIRPCDELSHCFLAGYHDLEFPNGEFSVLSYGTITSVCCDCLKETKKLVGGPENANFELALVPKNFMCERCEQHVIYLCFFGQIDCNDTCIFN
jgi:hypothetical protein